MIFDKIFFKVLKIKWVLMKVVGGVGGVGNGGRCTGCRVVGVLRETRRGSDVGVARVVGWWEFSERLRSSRGSWKGVGKIEMKNFAKGVAVKLLKPLAKFSNNERKNLF